MSRGRRAIASMAAICALGMAACGAAIPTATPRASPGETSSPSAATSPDPTRTASSDAPSALAYPDDDLRSQIDIVTVDPAVTDPLLAFVSDGQAIIFSSGRGRDTDADLAPDLWRYHPRAPDPELLWRNPERDRSIVKIAGDLGMIAFADMPLTAGKDGWKLWLLPRNETEVIQLDAHPGDDDVSAFVPSFAVYGETIVWTAFKAGRNGPVSQLLMASGPEWEPVVLHELSAMEAEIWLPSLLGSTLAYAEVHYSADRSTDERHVYLTEAIPGVARLRLDTSGLATMPVVVEGAVVWKEADEGFSMFNWGRMYRYDIRTQRVARLLTRHQTYVNYPSGGSRFVAYWPADSFRLSIYDLVRDEARLVATNSVASQESEHDVHLAGDLLVWRHLTAFGGDVRSELRYAFLPGVRDP